jgi:NADH dehydrogenase
MINTVAVIGGSGFLGRAVIEKLARADKRIIALCRNSDHAKFLKPMGRVGQITILSGDALDDVALEGVMAPADAVINLVGILAETGRQRFDALQGALPGRIGRLAGKYNHLAAVHISAIGANAESPSHYSQSKAAGEVAIQAEFPNCVVLRPSIIFGPRDSFFNRFAKMAQMLPALPLPGGGHMRMQPVYVEDVAEAVLIGLGVIKRMHKSSLEGCIFELGGPDIFTFRQLMELTLKYSHRRSLLVPVPFAALALGAFVTGLLPNPPLTRDQIRLLKLDNIVTEQALHLGDLGVIPTGLDTIIPSYLMRYGPGGSFRKQC